MQKWLQDHIVEVVVFLVGGAVSAAVWATSNFATITYVDKVESRIEKQLDKMDDKLDKLLEGKK